MMALIDSHGRQINYLRLSVTDRCNLRCQYCMPAQGVPKLLHEDILSFEAMHRIVRQAVSLGIEKLRITGGEPLVRKGLIGFVESLTSIPRLKEIALTTNGMLLQETAAGLRRAGVHRLNVSLDSLKPETFAIITRGGELSKALDGIRAAEEAGFPPVKINMVVMRGINDDEVTEFAALTISQPFSIRFIEYMPTAQATSWKSCFVAGHEILDRIRNRYSLSPEPCTKQTAGPARNFRIAGALGTVGVISPVSDHFCNTCNRVRITASGFAKGCLFGDGGFDLKPYLCRSDDDLRHILREVMTHKPAQHQLLNLQSAYTPFAMAQIGG